MNILYKFEEVQNLIQDYGNMVKLKGYNNQTRGQRLNTLIADVLNCWGIRAMANQRSAGEIDTSFELGGTRFIIEAKWEKKKISTGPIVKLQKRVRQRLSGTVGIFLSMSGYTEEALKDIKDGERLEVVLLDKNHFEGFLSGFYSPNEIINFILDKAHFEGKAYSPINDLLPKGGDIPANEYSSKSISDFLVTNESNIGIELLVHSMPYSDALIVRDENFILNLNRSHLVEYSLQLSRFDKILTLDQLHSYVIKTNDGLVLLRNNGVAIFGTEGISFIAGGFSTPRGLIEDNNNIWLAWEHRDRATTHITKITKNLGDQDNIYINTRNTIYSINGITKLGIHFIFHYESYIYSINESSGEIEKLFNLPASMEVTLMPISEEEVLIVHMEEIQPNKDHKVFLKKINIATHELINLASFNFAGSPYRLYMESIDRIYLLAHYHNSPSSMWNMAILALNLKNLPGKSLSMS